MPLPSPTVHRVQIPISDRSIVTMPAGARILHAAADYLGAAPTNPIIQLWYHCDLDQPQQRRMIRVIGTGNLAEVDPQRHIGTVIYELPGGRGVWHVFDEGPAAD